MAAAAAEIAGQEGDVSAAALVFWASYFLGHSFRGSDTGASSRCRGWLSRAVGVFFGWVALVPGARCHRDVGDLHRLGRWQMVGNVYGRFRLGLRRRFIGTPARDDGRWRQRVPAPSRRRFSFLFFLSASLAFVADPFRGHRSHTHTSKPHILFSTRNVRV